MFSTNGCAVRYEATVVDGDDLSYTIIYIGDDKKYTDSCLSFVQ